MFTVNKAPLVSDAYIVDEQSTGVGVEVGVVVEVLVGVVVCVSVGVAPVTKNMPFEVVAAGVPASNRKPG